MAFSFLNTSSFLFQMQTFSVVTIFTLLTKFGLVVKHGKSKVFHFSRAHSNFNPSLLDLSSFRGPILLPKNTWHYFSFVFNWKLLFRHYINFYANKAISTIKYMKMLGNSTRRLNPLQKRWLYRCYVLPIILYGFQL